MAEGGKDPIAISAPGGRIGAGHFAHSSHESRLPSGPVVTTGASTLKVQIPATAPPWLRVMTAIAVPAVLSPRAIAAQRAAAGRFVAKASGMAGYAAIRRR